jgi:hypothetical protein
VPEVVAVRVYWMHVVAEVGHWVTWVGVPQWRWLGRALETTPSQSPQQVRRRRVSRVESLALVAARSPLALVEADEQCL